MTMMMILMMTMKRTSAFAFDKLSSPFEWFGLLYRHIYTYEYMNTVNVSTLDLSCKGLRVGYSMYNHHDYHYPDWTELDWI